MTLPDRPDDYDRASVLRVASRLMSGREDPHIVLPVAGHVLMWLADDANGGTVQNRSDAMMQQYHNVRRHDGPGVTKFADAPDDFLGAAAQYVPFLAGLAEARP